MTKWKILGAVVALALCVYLYWPVLWSLQEGNEAQEDFEARCDAESGLVGSLLNERICVVGKKIVLREIVE